MSNRQAKKKALYTANLKVAKAGAIEEASPSRQALRRVDAYLHREFSKHLALAQVVSPYTDTSVMIGRPSRR